MKWEHTIKGLILLAAIGMMLPAFVALALASESEYTTGMQGSMEYWITETEDVIEVMEADGELEEIINCRRAILNCLRVILNQLEAERALREYGPPE